MNRIKQNIGYILDAVGFFTVGASSLAYLLLVRKFAEFHIQLPFLNFPIFVGEIFLFICLLVLAIKWIVSRKKLKSWQYLLFSYLIFVLLKAGFGYSKWGPLALRHSALFYYPLFAICSYSFYRREFFSKNFKLIFAILLILAVRTNIAYIVFLNQWFIFSSVLLTVVLIRKYPQKKIKFILFTLLLILIPYKRFLSTSRMMLVCSFLAATFMIVAFFYIIKMRSKLKVTLFFVFVVCLSLGLLVFSPSNEIMSLARIDKLKVSYRQDLRTIAEKEYSSIRKEIRPALYNPNFKPKTKSSLQVELQSEINKLESPGVASEVKNQGVFRERIEFEIEKVQTFIDEATVPLQELEKDLKAIQGEVESQPSLDDSEVPLQDLEKELEVYHEERKLHQQSQRYAMLMKYKDKISETLEDLEVIKPQAKQVGLADKLEEIKIAAKEVDSKVDVLKTELHKERTGAGARATCLFRVHIWRDMVSEILETKYFFGFDFGKPFRSKTIEMLNLGFGEWSRDGWIEPHNSYLNIIYRAGFVGLIGILFLLGVLFKMAKRAIVYKSVDGIILLTAIITMLIAANFAVILELPYNAIPLWSLLGVIFAYLNKSIKRTSNDVL